MRIETRHLRAHTDDVPGNRFRPTTWELDQQDRIIATATALFARFGRTGVTMHSFATALRMSATTIRRYFADLDALLAEILLRHLLAISTAIGETPRHTEHPKAARRAAYVAATRNGLNAHTQRHVLLLLRERHTLPPDLLELIEQLRLLLGECSPAHTAKLPRLAGRAILQPPKIEAMLASLEPVWIKRRRILSS